MTILNVNASAARVLVCMDSEVVALDRLRRAEQGKLMYLSNTNVVIGVRGIQVFAFELHWAAWNMPDASFDALDQAWAPEVFDAGFSQFVRVSRERGTQITDADAAGAEVVIAGYSERRGR